MLANTERPICLGKNINASFTTVNLQYHSPHAGNAGLCAPGRKGRWLVAEQHCTALHGGGSNLHEVQLVTAVTDKQSPEQHNEGIHPKIQSTYGLVSAGLRLMYRLNTKEHEKTLIKTASLLD